MQAKTKKVLRIIGNVVFWTFIAIVAVIMILSVVAKRSGKSPFKYTMVWVLTDSMERTIPEKSYILVKKANVAELKKGDIITFVVTDGAIRGKLNTHRIHEVVTPGEEFITKGDNNPLPDAEHVKKENVVYEYVGNLKIMTFFGRIFSSDMGFLTVASGIMIFIVVYTTITIKGAKKSGDDEEKQKEIARRVREEVEKLEKQNEQDKGKE